MSVAGIGSPICSTCSNGMHLVRLNGMRWLSLVILGGMFRNVVYVLDGCTGEEDLVLLDRVDFYCLPSYYVAINNMGVVGHIMSNPYIKQRFFLGIIGRKDKL